MNAINDPHHGPDPANPAAIDWNQRYEELHEREWQTRNRVLELLEVILERWADDAEKIGTLDGVVKLIEISSKLGRLATERVAGDQADTDAERDALPDDFREAIARIYGRRSPEPQLESGHE